MAKASVKGIITGSDIPLKKNKHYDAKNHRCNVDGKNRLDLSKDGGYRERR